MRSVRLMGEEVIPALRGIYPPTGLADELAKTPRVTTEGLQAARSGPAPSEVPT